MTDLKHKLVFNNLHADVMKWIKSKWNNKLMDFLNQNENRYYKTLDLGAGLVTN